MCVHDTFATPLCTLPLTCQLPNLEVVRLPQPRAEVAHHLCHQRLHGGDIHDLEGTRVDSAVRLAVQAKLVQDAQHCYVGLTGTWHKQQQWRQWMLRV